MSSFTEMDLSEMMDIEGGLDWETVCAGTALLVATIGVAATAPVSLPILVSGALCASSAVSGLAIAHGITH